jgi:hypothetical protein
MVSIQKIRMFAIIDVSVEAIKGNSTEVCDC